MEIAQSGKALGVTGANHSVDSESVLKTARTQRLLDCQ